MGSKKPRIPGLLRRSAFQTATYTYDASGNILNKKKYLLTLIQIENPAYGDKPAVNANFLVPVVGAQKWVIYREKDDIIVDHPTMLALLNSLQENPRIEGSHKERVIIFKWRE